MEKLFKKYITGTCTPEEYSRVVGFIRQAENNPELGDQLRKFWNNIHQEDIKVPANSELLDRIHHQISLTENKSTLRSLSVYRISLQIAAVLILGLIITSVWLFQQRDKAGSAVFIQQITTPLASRTNFELPDGSKVWLNAGSTISFPSSFNQKLRKVKLMGEAYFDVRKNKVPFVVETSGFSVNVLGTAFNVMAYEGQVPSVTLERGKVELQHDGKVLGSLLPGQQADIPEGQNTISVKVVDPGLITSWKENILIFQAEPLGILAKRLERWYNLKINIEDQSLNSLKVTGKIELESISEVLDLMEYTLPIKYQYNKNERILTIIKKN